MRIRQTPWIHRITKILSFKEDLGYSIIKNYQIYGHQRLYVRPLSPMAVSHVTRGHCRKLSSTCNLNKSAGSQQASQLRWNSSPESVITAPSITCSKNRLVAHGVNLEILYKLQSWASILIIVILIHGQDQYAPSTHLLYSIQVQKQYIWIADRTTASKRS